MAFVRVRNDALNVTVEVAASRVPHLSDGWRVVQDTAAPNRPGVEVENPAPEPGEPQGVAEPQEPTPEEKP